MWLITQPIIMEQAVREGQVISPPEGFRKKVSTFNDKNDKAMSVVNYIMEYGVDALTKTEVKQ